MPVLRCGRKTFSNIEAIVFDKDGTLEDSDRFALEMAKMRASCIDARVPGTRDRLLATFGVLEDGSLYRQGLMGVGCRAENITAAAAYLAARGYSWEKSLTVAGEAIAAADDKLTRTAENTPMFPGTLALLQRLRAAGLKLAILSSAGPERVDSFVTRHQLSEYFQVTRGVTPQGLRKPDPELFWEVCAGLGVEAGATLMLGDGSLDLLMAKRAGAAGAVAVCWYGDRLENADATITRFEPDAIDLVLD